MEYKIEGIFKCNSKDTIYVKSCKFCGKQYVGSATGFKEQFIIHKSDLNTGNVRYGLANRLLNICHSSVSKSEYLQLQLMQKFLFKMVKILTNFCRKKKITEK